MTLLQAINLILVAASMIVLLPIAVFCGECLAALLFGRRRLGTPADCCGASESAEALRTVVLIPAHNEELVISQTLEAIQNATSREAALATRILVVADNCDDQTANVARRAGAEVIERTDIERRGKGYALQAGIESLQADPPDVVIVIDADCLPHPGTIATLSQVAWKTQRPVQALNLTDRNPADGPFQAVSLLGNLFTNLIRPLGLRALGAPCRMTGTGMAFPWRLTDSVRTAGGNLVEDMEIGIDLARQGHMPLFCPGARVTSALPTAGRAFASQRTRWEHGHLRTAIAQTPRLLSAAIRGGSWPLLAMALDLAVPPLTLLVALWLGAGILAGAAWWFGASWTPIALLAGGGLAMTALLGLGWAAFCRRQVSFRAFVGVPLYMIRKVPIYVRFLFQRQHVWVRTERESAASQSNLRPHIVEGKTRHGSRASAS